jgi:hypothetical protein
VRTAAGADQSDRLDQLAAQNAKRHGIKQQHTLIGKSKDARLFNDLQTQAVALANVGGRALDLHGGVRHERRQNGESR